MDEDVGSCDDFFDLPMRVWYFSMGSMMNPTVTINREIFPLESHPAKLPDFRLHFGPGVVTGAVMSKGDCIHGIAHLIEAAQMEELDDILLYLHKRVKAFCQLYKGREVEAIVYVWEDEVDFEKVEIPAERYIENMLIGCDKYGIDTEYVEWIRKQSSEPRKGIEQCKLLKIPQGLPVLTIEEIEKEELMLTLNRKVFQFVGDREYYDYFVENVDKIKEKCIETHMSSIYFDPKLGIVKDRNSATLIHAAQIEDKLLSEMEDFGTGDWKLIGTFDQIFQDE